MTCPPSDGGASGRRPSGGSTLRRSGAANRRSGVQSVGVYRFWRDLGYAVGALLAGVVADLLGIYWAIGIVGGLTLCSGIVTALTMRETAKKR